MNPGHSIVIQPMRPGKLSLPSTEVFPMPYHDISHWMDANLRTINVSWEPQKPQDFVYREAGT